MCSSDLTQFKTAIKIDPANVQANLNIGYLALDSGDYALARGAFEAVVKQFPGNQDAQMGYAVALRGSGDKDDMKKAEGIYETLLQRDPTNRTLVFNATMLQQKYLKNFDKAKKILDDYQKAAGTLSPSDDFFKWQASVDEDREKERKRQDELKRIEQERIDREKRQKEQLDALQKVVTDWDKDLKNECVAATEAGMMASAVLDQAKSVLQEKDLQMVGDVMTFVEQTRPDFEAAKAGCAGAPAPAPDGGAPAPAPDGATPAPAPAPAPGGAAPAPAPGQ